MIQLDKLGIQGILELLVREAVLTERAACAEIANRNALGCDEDSDAREACLNVAQEILNRGAATA